LFEISHRALLANTETLKSRRGLVIFDRLGFRPIWLAAERLRFRSEPLFRFKGFGLLIELSFGGPLHLLVVNILERLVKTAGDRLDLLDFSAHLFGLDQIIVHTLIAEFILAGRCGLIGLWLGQAPLVKRFDIIRRAGGLFLGRGLLSVFRHQGLNLVNQLPNGMKWL